MKNQDVRRARLAFMNLSEYRNGFGCGGCYIENGNAQTPAPCLHFMPQERMSRKLQFAIRGPLRIWQRVLSHGPYSFTVLMATASMPSHIHFQLRGIQP